VVHPHNTAPTEGAVVRARRLVAPTVHTVLLVLLKNSVFVRAGDGRFRLGLFYFSLFLLCGHVCVDVADLDGLRLVFNLLFEVGVRRLSRLAVAGGLHLLGANHEFEVVRQLVVVVAIVVGDEARLRAHAVGVRPEHERPQRLEHDQLRGRDGGPLLVVEEHGPQRREKKEQVAHYHHQVDNQKCSQTHCVLFKTMDCHFTDFELFARLV
jgi:hypothetical protein